MTSPPSPLPHTLPASAETRRVRVAYLVPPSAHFAGMERVTHELASELAEHHAASIAVSVIYFTDYPEVRNAPYRIIRASGDRVRDVPAGLHRVLATNDFDVIVIPQFENAVLSLIYNRLHGLRDRIVLHLHGNPDIERVMSVKSRLVFTLYRATATWFAGIVTVSPGLARSVLAALGGKGAVRYLPNPVRQLPPVGGHATQAQHFVTVGRLAHQKGHDIAIRAFRNVVDQFPRATFAIVGDGPEHQALATLIETLDLTGNVFLKGVISDPSRELAAASAFVSASRWEGFGVAIVEALSAGLPVIAARCDFGPEDIVTRPELGTLVPPGDPAALAEAMIRHLSTAPLGSPEDRIAHAAGFARSAVAAEHAAYLSGFGTQH